MASNIIDSIEIPISNWNSNTPISKKKSAECHLDPHSTLEIILPLRELPTLCVRGGGRLLDLTHINPYQYLPIFTHIYPYLPIFTQIDPYLPIFTHIEPYLPIFTHTYTYLPIFTNIYPYVLIFTHTYPYLPIFHHID